MKNEEYWEKRQVQNMYHYMEQAEDTADQIADVYYRSSRWLSNEAEDIFERYRKKHHLSEAEARRLLNTLHDKTDIDELIQKLKNGVKDQERRELIAELESSAYRARLERLSQLQSQIDILMTQVYKQEKKLSTSFYLDLANEAYYRTIYDMQQRTQAAFSFSYIDEKAINDAVNSRWSGENYSKRIWGNTQELAQDLKEELIINLVTGRTERETADVIAMKFAQGSSKARRLVRTESSYLSSEMNFRAYEEAGVEEYQFLATLDLKTSKVCRELDGKIFRVKDRKVGVNCNPMHPWCRSTTVSVVSRELLSKLTRAALDPATGKGITVPGTMTYQQWYDKYVKNSPEAKLEEKKVKNRAADRREYQKYQEILGKNAPESLVKFQDIKYTDSEKWNALKRDKEEALKHMDYSDISNLNGRLTDRETRIWYKAQDEKIPSLIGKDLSLEQQARQACELRNQNRTSARELMQNQAKRRELDISDPNKSFEQLLHHKMEDKGLSYDDALADIIQTATKTRKSVNKTLGLE